MKQPNPKAGPAVKRGSRLSLQLENVIAEHPVQVTVERFRNGQIWIKGSSSALHEGDTLVLEYLIADEGRYLAMLDVSAGGIRFETDEDLEIDQEFVCQFELSDPSRYELHSRGVRSQKKPGYSSRYRVAVEFLDLTDEHCSQLLRWIYQEQSRRHKPTDPATR